MATLYSPKIVTNGLVLALDAGNRKSYPGSGTTWTDVSGNGNNGTLTNGPTFNSANMGSIVFDGTNDYVATNITSSTLNFTWDFWINLNVTQPNNTNFWCYFYNMNGGQMEMGIYYTTSSVTQSFMMVNYDYAPTRPSVSRTIPMGSWVNITLGCNNLIPFMYTNASNYVTGSAFDNLNLPINALFYSTGYGGRALRGNLANFKVYNRPLTAQEILQNFNATRSRFGV